MNHSRMTHFHWMIYVIVLKWGKWLENSVPLGVTRQKYLNSLSNIQLTAVRQSTPYDLHLVEKQLLIDLCTLMNTQF